MNATFTYLGRADYRCTLSLGSCPVAGGRGATQGEARADAERQLAEERTEIVQVAE